MKVVWLCDGRGWAYAARVRQLIPELPDYEHEIFYMVSDGVDSAIESIENADIVVCMYVRYMEFVHDKAKTVINLGGMRPFQQSQQVPADKPRETQTKLSGRRSSTILRRLRAFFGCYRVLSVENSMSWSWGNVIGGIIKRLKRVCFVRMNRYQTTYIGLDGKSVTKQSPIAAGLVDHFDVTMLQNIDSIRLVEGSKDRVVARMGGMMLGENHDKNRYNKDLAKVGGIIASSQELYEIGKNANDNTVLIPNGCDIDLFSPAEGFLSDERLAKPFTVGFVGNIWGAGAAYKGWKYYVRATEVDLAMEVERKNILHGQNDIPNEDMPAYYQSIDCIVMPSQGEGCSNTVKEALACGVPVLITKVGYHGEMLRDGETCLVIKRDAADIVEKIRMLMNDSELRKKLAWNGRLFAENYHDVRKIAKQYDDVFRKVIRSNTNG